MAQSFMQQFSKQSNLYEQKYKTARMNLLLVVIFTAVNMALLVTNADSYFMFSAFVPYYLTSVGMFLCGYYPAEYYTGDFKGMPIYDGSVFVVLFAISVVLTLLYLLAWLFSKKKRVGWFIFALVFFSIDTIAMLYINGLSFDMALDILFHAWVIYYLVLGITSHYKQKKLPAEEELALHAEGLQETPAAPFEAGNSIPLYTADPNVNYRVLLETQVGPYNICYRRTNHINELVVNGAVYARLEGVVELPHTLKAYVDGHFIQAVYTGTHSVILFDGQTQAEKPRLL